MHIRWSGHPGTIRSTHASDHWCCMDGRLPSRLRHCRGRWRYKYVRYWSHSNCCSCLLYRRIRHDMGTGHLDFHWRIIRFANSSETSISCYLVKLVSFERDRYSTQEARECASRTRQVAPRARASFVSQNSRLTTILI